MKISAITLFLITAFLTCANAQTASTSALSDALFDLLEHIQGKSPLTAEQIDQRAQIITKETELIGSTPTMIRQAFSVVDAYENEIGPLFMNNATRRGFNRQATGGLEIHRAIFALQQGLLDHAYTSSNVQQHYRLLNGPMFKTSAYFPGAVAEQPDHTITHTVKINASQPQDWGSPVMYADHSARRPTGCYLAPGTIAQVTVPSALVNQGYSIRVGAHSWDLKKKPKIKRLDRVSLLYPIESTSTIIANPLGGGIYIEVPHEADAGLVDIQIRNAVRSPYYSARSFDQTTPQQWLTERRNPGPWTDFETDKFMMQVPTSWITDFDTPEQLMQDWDAAMDAVSRLMGLPLVRNKSVLYLQVDVIIRGSAYYPGYPQSNTPYNPHSPKLGNERHWLLRGPQHGGATIFHEIGHAQLFTKFKGEVEAVVNLPYVAVLNQGFGVDLNTAFGKSFHKETVSLDQAAIMWMVTENFRAGKPMDITNSEQNEVRYQHRGYAKYVEIVHLFGWQVLEDFWHSVHLDYLKGIQYSRNNDPADNRILRMSKIAGVDLTPLVHFWGIQPDDAITLKREIENAGLQPSARIYDQLKHYQRIIPMNTEAFAAHAKVVYPKGIRAGKNPNYGEGWYHTWLPNYNASHGEAAQQALQTIIDTYFPNGRPVGNKAKANPLPTVNVSKNPPIEKQAQTKPLKVFILAGQSNMQGHAKVSTFDHMAMDPKTAPLLKEMRDSNGAPRICDKVWISAIGIDKEERHGPLTVGYGAAGKDLKIGPEFSFGITLQRLMDEPILIIKTAWGGKSLHTDFRPPSMGKYQLNQSQKERISSKGHSIDQEQAKANDASGHYYRLMLEHVEQVLQDIGRVYPDYNPSQGYELAGFVWFQGWNDLVNSGVYPDRDKPGGYDAYSECLEALIRDVRSDLEAPDMKVVIGVMGTGGPLEQFNNKRNQNAHGNFRQAMAAPTLLPEFEGTVSAVQTADYWDLELGNLQERWEQLKNKSRSLDKDKTLSPEQRKERLDQYKSEQFTPAELELRELAISNAAYHYLGSAKITAQIGQAFAQAMHGLIAD
ncbi:MAG: M60 family metallopeptidase [Coraliomargarita sp.]